MNKSWYAPGAGLRMQQSAPAVPGPGEVLLAPAYTGICGTDLHALHGAFDARIGAGTVLGHEVSAVVTDVGPGVADWAAGDHVAIFPQEPDGTCDACSRGHRHVCRNMNFFGLDSPGSLQDWWTVPIANLVRVPDGLDLAVAALIEPTAVAVHDVERAQVVAGEHVLVVGGGPVGVLIACVARARSADVAIVEPNPARLAALRRLGFTGWHPDHVADEVRAWTAGAGVDVAFEVSGSAPGAATAVELAAVRGRVCVVGIHPAPRALDLHRIFERELTLVGARLYQRQDFEAAVEFVTRRDFPGRQLITRTITLSDLVAGAHDLGRDPEEMKVLVAGRGA